MDIAYPLHWTIFKMCYPQDVIMRVYSHLYNLNDIVFFLNNNQRTLCVLLAIDCDLWLRSACRMLWRLMCSYFRDMISSKFIWICFSIFLIYLFNVLCAVCVLLLTILVLDLFCFWCFITFTIDCTSYDTDLQITVSKGYFRWWSVY